MMHRFFIIPTFFIAFLLPLALWPEAPVIDGSDDFAMNGEQQVYRGSAVSQKYEDPQYGRPGGSYPKAGGDESPLVREENYQAMDSNSQLNENAKVIDRVQSLRQEIQGLRGQLEIQAHELKLLKEQQLAFYKDLDARLGSAQTKTESKTPTDTMATTSKAPFDNEPAPEPRTSKTTPVTSLNTGSRLNPANEQISYLAAYELVTTKRYDEALKAMHHFVQTYPQSGYSANAEYWLGELYLLKKDYPKAKEHFETVLEQFPSSSKAAAAMLKDGYAYAACGEVSSAKKRLQQVIKTYPKTTAAELATAKLVSLQTL